jgi:hypothetical protein
MCTFVSSVVNAVDLPLLTLGRHRQPENRNLPRPRHIQTTRLLRIRQIKRLTMFAAIHFCIAPPGLLHIAASLLQRVGGVKPALEMPSAKLALLVLLVASPLSRLLHFDFVVRKLRSSLCPRGYGSASGQRIYPRRRGPCAARFTYETSILLEPFCGMPGLQCAAEDESRRDPTGARAALFLRTLPRSAKHRAAFGATRGRTSDRGSLPSAA